MPSNPSPAVGRALDVLELLARSPGEVWTLAELARQLEMPRATCHAVVLALLRRGYVVRHEPGTLYALGPANLALGDAARESLPWLPAASPTLHTLAADVGLAVATAVRDRTDIMLSLVTAPRLINAQPLAQSLIGERIGLAAPFGAVFVAWEEDSAADEWIGRSSQPVTSRERDLYRRALAATHRRGYAVAVLPRTPSSADLQRTIGDADHAALARREMLAREFWHSEYLIGELDPSLPYRVAQWSAPVFDRDGHVLLALLLLGPLYDLHTADVTRLGERLRIAALEVTTRLGGAVPAR